MNCKPNLLGASALYGTLALVALGTAQPARAACTTLTDDQQRKILTCTGDNEGPVAVPVDIDQFRNSGTIAPAAGTPGSGVTGGPGSAGIVNDGTIRGDLSSAISVKSLRAGARITNNGTLTVDNSQSRGANNFGILVEQSGTGLTTIIENAGRIEADGPYGGGILAYGNARILHAGPNALIEIGGLGGTAISGERADVSILAPVRAAEGNGVVLTDRSTVDNSSEIIAGSNGIYMGRGGSVVNRPNAVIRSTGGTDAALDLNDGNVEIVNEGIIDVAGIAADRAVIAFSNNIGGPEMVHKITNAALGTIGHAGMTAGAQAIRGNDGMRFELRNTGRINGDILLAD
ncbi:MAG TPA: hypothetical protein VEZ59_02770, partial [Sphingopyxis sp.]|nr:hypothetical protein [Sphingopyxis sp.]